MLRIVIDAKKHSSRNQSGGTLAGPAGRANPKRHAKPAARICYGHRSGAGVPPAAVPASVPLAVPFDNRDGCRDCGSRDGLPHFAGVSVGMRPAPEAPAQGAGLGPGEIPSRACRHNVNYWRGGSFYGLGPAATSYVRGVRANNWPDTARYCEELEQGRRAFQSREELPPLARAGETAAFGLRLAAGWPFEKFQQTTGFDLRHGWADEMADLVERGWARLDAERFQLTPLGLRFADAAAREFLRPG
jgi:hypothetical protein